MKGKNIIVGICGGIAAYKTPQLVRLLKKRGANVKVALTEGGARFVSELSLATVSEEPVYGKIFPPMGTEKMDFTRHISSRNGVRLTLIGMALSFILLVRENITTDTLLAIYDKY